ncbi:MAG: c-type cytochrome [Panacagrimonas sp.]
MHSPGFKHDPPKRRRIDTDRRWPSILACLLSSMTVAWASQATAEQKAGRIVYTEQSGRRIFDERCARCHMADGSGQSTGDTGVPPLTGMSQWFATREGQRYAAHAVIFGPYGGVMVGGKRYAGFMSRFGTRFTNEQMVAVLRYVAEELNRPLPDYKPIDTAVIAEARLLPDTIDALHAERDALPVR